MKQPTSHHPDAVLNTAPPPRLMSAHQQTPHLVSKPHRFQGVWGCGRGKGAANFPSAQQLANLPKDIYILEPENNEIASRASSGSHIVLLVRL